MKRWMICWLALGFARAANADLSVSTFEDLNPGQASNFVNDNAGGGPNGQFVSGGNSFNNIYDTSQGGGFLGGFAISSQTNVANPGSGSGDYNYLYLAAPGMRPVDSTTPIPAAGGAETPGGNPSLTYAIGFTYTPTADPFHPSGSIVNLAAGSSPLSVQVTNTAYDVLSMAYGDGFVTKFDASDFLKLTIQGYSQLNGLGAAVGQELDVSLASNGTMLTTWETLDLTRFSGAESLVFGIESSQTNLSGIVAPAAFALDNLTVSTPSTVPEPSSLMLSLGGIGIGSLVLRHVRSRKGLPGMK